MAAPWSSLVHPISLLLLVTSTFIVWADIPTCADEIPCEQRGGGCASCLAPASYASGFRCETPKALNFLPALLDSPYCHYCESTGKCMGHKELDEQSCPELMKFEEECPLGSIQKEDEFLSNWMGMLLEVSGGSMTLLDLSLVGSHDATSYDLDVIYSTSASLDAREAVDDNAAIAGLIVDKFKERAMSFARRAAETQFLTITEQLNSGVRFIDLRINYETDLEEWYSLHTLRTAHDIYFYLDEIKDWMLQHPKEVVVIWLSRQGSTTDRGTAQFPGATTAQKAEFWSRYIEIFDGMLIDVVSNPPQTTPLDNIAGKILTYASDYVELTDSSIYALNAAVDLSNNLGVGIIGEVAIDGSTPIEFNYNFEQDQFSQATTTRLDKPNTFHLLSMSTSAKPEWIKEASFVELNPVSTDKASAQSTCNALFNVPNFKEDWCPMSLMDIILLTNHYKQLTIEQTRLNSTWDFPNAIYIDGIDVDGTIRTSTHLPWNQARSDFFGNKEDSIQRYGVVWAFIQRNLRIACGDDSQTSNAEKCAEYIQKTNDGLSRYPEARWEDLKFGRVTQWPEAHPTDNVLSRVDVGTSSTNDTSVTSGSSHQEGWVGRGYFWMLGVSSCWFLMQQFFW